MDTREAVPACRIPLAVLSISLCIAAPAAAQESRAGAAEQKPKLKAIFEPVNYPQNLELMDVAFVSEEEGWASGAAGTILHTTDCGKTWTPQLGGDPAVTGNAVVDLRFPAPKTGFAAQSAGSGDHTLLRTTDGESWTKSGTVGQHRGDYDFSSSENGVYVHTDGIFHTTNGGKTWKKAYTCSLSLQVDGLARQTKCHFEAVHFATPQVAYAVSRDLTKKSFAVGRSDGGPAPPGRYGPPTSPTPRPSTSCSSTRIAGS